MSVFHSSTIKRIKPFAAPTLVEYKPNVIIIYVGCNVVAKQKMDTADLNKIADDIIDIANLCASYGVFESIIWPWLSIIGLSVTSILITCSHSMTSVTGEKDLNFKKYMPKF